MYSGAEIIMNFIQVNKLVIKAINTQDKNIFCEIMDTLMKNNIQGIFKKKRYVWNIIRPRDIYKLIAYWIEINITSDKLTERIDIMHELLETTKDKKIRQSFVWGLLKKVNLLTVYTIQYASKDKIQNIIAKIGLPDQKVYSDDILYPLLLAFTEQIKNHNEEIEILNKLIEL
jgi:hypothetical protein